MPDMPSSAVEPAARIVLGFDHGRARIGVAVGQTLTADARPLTTLRGTDWGGIEGLVREWRPDLLVVGVPRHADGSASVSTVAALDFARELTARTGLSVRTVDERLSSREAEQRLREQGIDPRRAGDRVDAMAAAVILETWFNQLEPAGAA